MSGILRTVGQFAAYGVGMLLGGPLGGAVANTLFNIFMPMDNGQPQQGSQLSDLMREGAEYDTVIPEFFGTMPCKGNVIDCGVDAQGNPAGIEEVVTERKQKRGTGGGGGSGGSNKIKEYSYYMTAAFLLGYGPLYVDQIIEENADGEKVVYDRWKNDGINPVPGSDEWHDLWKDIALGNEAYKTGSGIIMTPEFEDGILIAEHSQNLRLYPGTERQKPDTTLEVIHGVGNVSPYRGSSYAMLNRYGPLNGNTSFRFTVRSLINGRVETITKRLCDAGVSLSRIKLTSIEGTLAGAAVTSIEPGRQLAEKIAGAVFHDILFMNGAFRDASRANPAFWVIEPGQLGAHVVSGSGTNYPSKTTIQRKNQKELPSRLLIRFLDKNLNYEQNTAIATRESAPFENEVSIEFPFASTLQEMTMLADITLDEMWSSIGEEKISLLPGHIQIAPGNVVIYMDSTGPRAIRIIEEDVGTKGPLELTGAPYDQAVFGVHRILENLVRPRPEVIEYGLPIVYMGDLPSPYQPALRSSPYLTWAATTSSEKAWAGAYIISNDSNLDGQSVSITSVIGELAEDFVYGEEHLYKYNYDLVCRVKLLGRGTLSSAESEADVTAGANQIAIGNLIISFVTATAIGGGVIELSGIWPGRFGTDHIQSVPEDTKTLLLTDNSGNFGSGIETISLPLSRRTQTLEYEAVSSADDTKSSGDLDILVEGNSMIPPRPTVVVETDEDGDKTIKVHIRTRDQDSVEAYWNSGIGPFDTDPRKATVVIYEDGNEVDRQTITGTDIPLQLSYTAAELAAFGGGVLTGEAWHEGTFFSGQKREFDL